MGSGSVSHLGWLALSVDWRISHDAAVLASAGFNGANMNLTRLPEYVQYAPSGESPCVVRKQSWRQALLGCNKC